jgi:kinetochore protein Spc7/SPC105
MNFNNPEDLYSSSPLSGDNQSPGSAEADGSPEADDDGSGEVEDTPDTEDSSQSSAKLDAALRQAYTQAGTQKLDHEDEGDMTMDMTTDIVEDDVTASFRPWAKRSTGTQLDQENVNPDSPASSASDEGEDMSMDITRAVGRIVPQEEGQSSDMDDDMSMELTMPLGSIKAMDAKAPANRRKSLKRRVSVVEASQGSPAKRPASRRTSLRQRRQSEEKISEDVTMDLTMAIGGIKGAIAFAPRRASVDTAFDDVTMDFTLAVGSIKNDASAGTSLEESEPEDEDLSMEFTKIVGPGIKRAGRPAVTPEKPAEAVVSRPTLSKTPTPQKSPQKSPRQRRGFVAPKQDNVLEHPVQATPAQQPEEVHYPNLDPGTPEIVRQRKIEDIEPSPFVRKTPQSASKNSGVNTPTGTPKREAHLPIPEDPIAAPILNRRRSSLSNVQFSPLNAPRDEPSLKSTALLSNNIKLLSTPRKQTLMSPMKRGMTPNKSQTPQKQPTPKQKTPTPRKATTPRKSMSPKKRVVFGEPQEEVTGEADDTAEYLSEVERISLQEFLDMTKIRFMDLSTTKRRHTAAPALFHDTEVEEKEETLDRYVVAGACTLPEYELYQHACHEMKKYISDGRHFVRTMEGNVLEENPLLFSEYLTAPPDQRTIMDNQFKNLKTNARLEARGEWYTWRSTLLHDLKSGLLGTLDGFRRDETKLANQEQLLDTVLPSLVEKQTVLSTECKQLQKRHDELNSCDREELEETREKLVATDAELEERRKVLQELQQDLADKEARIEAVKERKVECVEETKAAERVREECRGWSTSEVRDLQGMNLRFFVKVLR